MTSRTTAAHPPRPRRVLGRALAAVFCVLTVGLATAGPAGAHAELVDTTPVSGAQLDTAPASIVLRWNEPVQTGVEQLHLIAADGTPTSIDVTVSSGEQTTATLTPADTLGNGSWTVSWKVVSADGHLIGGAYAFVVGDGTATIADGVAASTGRFDRSDRVAETFAWTAVLFAAGALLARRRGVAQLVALAAAAVAVYRVWWLAEGYGSGVWRVITDVGEAASSAATAASGVVLFAAATLTGVWSRRLLVTAGVMFVGQGMFSGHHLDLDGMLAGPALVAHLAHLFAGALWMASVVALLFDRSTEQLRGAARRGSVSIAVLLPSALALSAFLAWPFGADDGAWFMNLVVKSAFVGVALAFGAWHHRRVLANQHVGFGSVAVELMVMAAVLGAAATLTQHVPGAIAQQRAQSTALNQGVVDTASESFTVSFDDGSTGVLELVPSAGYPSVWMLTLTDPAGAALPAVDLSVEASNLRGGVEALPVELAGAGDHWMGTNTIPFAGSWQVAIAVYLDQFTVVNAVTTLEFTQ